MAARERGARVLAETCPQYLFLTDDVLRQPSETAQDFLCTPPVRSSADRSALWEGLAAGDLDAVATDHCPFTMADRRGGVLADGWRDFTQIPGGLPGVETRPSLVYQGVLQGRLSLERWIEVVASTPARLFGLGDRKGRLEPGLDADLVVWDPAATRRLEAGSLHMRTDHSPYASTTVTGWPALTISRGTVVARDGEPAQVEAGRGRFLPRRPYLAGS